MNEEDLQFQDFCMKLLYKDGMPICIYGSQKYQIEEGESIGRVEIKHDKKMKDTGNIYIEYAERHDPQKAFVYSGILRDDNTLYYMIGDYERIFLLGKYQLLAILHNFEKKGTPTSKGIVVPIEYLEKHKPIILMEWKNGNEKKNYEISEIRKEPIFNIY